MAMRRRAQRLGWLANSGIIQFGTFLTLWFSERRRPWWSGFVMGLSFSATKLLALLSWPALTLYDRRSWRQRAIPAGVILLATAGLLLLGVDTLTPVRLEFGKYTSGNIWYPIVALFPALRETGFFKYAPTVVFALVFFPALLVHWRRVGELRLTSRQNFDKTCAFAGFTNLLFMIFSRKAFAFYLPMCLLPILHTAVTSENRRRAIYAVTLLGGTTTVGDMLWLQVRSVPHWGLTLPQAQLLFEVDVLVVGAYFHLLLTCSRRFLRETPHDYPNARDYHQPVLP